MKIFLSIVGLSVLSWSCSQGNDLQQGRAQAVDFSRVNQLQGKVIYDSEWGTQGGRDPAAWSRKTLTKKIKAIEIEMAKKSSIYIVEATETKSNGYMTSGLSCESGDKIISALWNDGFTGTTSITLEGFNPGTTDGYLWQTFRNYSLTNTVTLTFRITCLR